MIVVEITLLILHMVMSIIVFVLPISYCIACVVERALYKLIWWYTIYCKLFVQGFKRETIRYIKSKWWRITSPIRNLERNFQNWLDREKIEKFDERNYDYRIGISVTYVDDDFKELVDEDAEYQERIERLRVRRLSRY